MAKKYSIGFNPANSSWGYYTTYVVGVPYYDGNDISYTFIKNQGYSNFNSYPIIVAVGETTGSIPSAPSLASFSVTNYPSWMTPVITPGVLKLGTVGNEWYAPAFSVSFTGTYINSTNPKTYNIECNFTTGTGWNVRTITLNLMSAVEAKDVNYTLKYMTERQVEHIAPLPITASFYNGSINKYYRCGIMVWNADEDKPAILNNLTTLISVDDGNRIDLPFSPTLGDHTTDGASITLKITNDTASSLTVGQLVKLTGWEWNFSTSAVPASASGSSTTITIGFNTWHGLRVGQWITVAGTWTGITGAINGNFQVVSIPTGLSITYTTTAVSGTASVFGTVSRMILPAISCTIVKKFTYGVNQEREYAELEFSVNHSLAANDELTVTGSWTGLSPRTDYINGTTRVIEVISPTKIRIPAFGASGTVTGFGSIQASRPVPDIPYYHQISQIVSSTQIKLTQVGFTGNPTTVGTGYAEPMGAIKRIGLTDANVSTVPILKDGEYWGPDTYQTDAGTFIAKDVIAGYPISSGTFPVKLKLNISSDAGVLLDTRYFNTTLTINAGPPVITNVMSTAEQDEFYSHQIIATNNPTAYTCSNLPTGLSLNATTGLISGKPVAPLSGSYDVTITATNSSGTGTKYDTLLVILHYPPTIQYNPLQTAYLSTAYVSKLSATNNPTNWSGYGLPSSLILTSGGYISGAVDSTLGSASPLACSAIAYNTYGASNVQGYSLTVCAKPPTLCLLIDIKGNRYINFSSVVNPVAPVDWSIPLNPGSTEANTYISTTLPTGLTLDTSTAGVLPGSKLAKILGTPIVSGSYVVTIQASNDGLYTNTSASNEFGVCKVYITIFGPPPEITSITPNNVKIGDKVIVNGNNFSTNAGILLMNVLGELFSIECKVESSTTISFIAGNYLIVGMKYDVIVRNQDQQTDIEKEAITVCQDGLETFSFIGMSHRTKTDAPLGTDAYINHLGSTGEVLYYGHKNGNVLEYVYRKQLGTDASHHLAGAIVLKGIGSINSVPFMTKNDVGTATNTELAPNGEMGNISSTFNGTEFEGRILSSNAENEMSDICYKSYVAYTAMLIKNIPSISESGC